MSDDTDGSSNKLDYALDLMRRLPPRQIESNLVDLTELSPELTDSLLSAIDQPLKIAMDKKVGKEYLICEYNRDADSYRSPWSNEYEPPFDEEGIYPSASLRKLEIEANAAFEIYRDLYYDGGVSSVYLWDSKQGFAGVVLIKKTGNDASGCWDSIHVVEVNERNRAMSGKIHYKLTSTVMLWLEGNSNAAGKLNLGGSLMRQKEMDTVYDESHSHVANLGRMIEEMENQIRQSLNAVYFDKTKSILNSLRSTSGDKDKAKMDAFRGELMSKMMNRHST